MVVNPEKFPAIITNRQNKSNSNSILKINNIKIKPKKIVTPWALELTKNYMK